MLIIAPAAPRLPQAAAKLEVGCTCLKNGVDEGYPCPSMKANDQGLVTCRLPNQNIPLGETADCTVSVLDQRDWGGCVDVQMVSAAAVLPPVPPTPVLSSSGAYQITKNTVIDTSAASFTCCALEAELIVPTYQMEPGAASFTATLSGKANGCTAALRPLPLPALTPSLISCCSSTLSHSRPQHPLPHRRLGSPVRWLSPPGAAPPTTLDLPTSCLTHPLSSMATTWSSTCKCP